jgi:hypothetical protein
MSPLDPDAKTYEVVCLVCGTYRLDGTLARHDLLPVDPETRNRLYLLSGLTKAARLPIFVDHSTLESLRAGVPADKSVTDKIALMVRWFAERSTHVGHEIPTNRDVDYPAAYCRNPEEWQALLGSIVGEMGFLNARANAQTTVAVLLKGWEWLADKPKASGAKVFVAMSFDPALNDVKSAIEIGIRTAGYDPLRVDEDPFVGGIPERIAGHIRESKFIVADLTGNRGGVYYEAGFAAGLSIPVLHTCVEGEQLHFDVQHLNFLRWQKAELGRFSERLRERVLALYGRGPIDTG